MVRKALLTERVNAFDVLNPKFSKRITSEREAHKISTAAFAKKISVTHDTILRAESGQTEITPVIASKIAKYLHIDLDEYKRESDEETLRKFSSAVGNAIVKYRERSRLKPETLARRIGVPASLIAAWEAGKSEPRLPQITAISKVLGCQVEDLMREARAISMTEAKISPLARRIEAARTARGMSLSTLAALAGVAVSTISRLVSGTNQGMDANRVARIANALRVSADYLAGRTDNMDETTSGAAAPNLLPLFPGATESLGSRIEAIQQTLDEISRRLDGLQEIEKAVGELAGLVGRSVALQQGRASVAQSRRNHG